ncbi:MAG: tetratricopeptide repeat protein [Bacteroidetes bacterium]|nr:tetratricopeptide repeat protein [Bacteroidota bacterium]
MNRYEDFERGLIKAFAGAQYSEAVQLLYRHGIELAAAGDPRAADDLKRAFDYAAEGYNNDLLPAIALELGHVRRREGRHEEAAEWYARAFRATLNEESLPHQADEHQTRILRRKARGRFHAIDGILRGRSQIAAHAGNSALREVDPRRIQAEAAIGFGSLAAGNGEPERAIQMLLTAMATWDNGSSEHANIMGRLMHALANVYAVSGDRDGALDYINRAIELLRACGDQIEEVRALTSEAAIHLMSSNLDMAEQIALKAVAIYEELGSRQNVIQTLMMLGDVRQARGDHDSAYAYYQRAYDMRGDDIDQPTTLLVIRKVGDVRLSLNDLPAAQLLYEHALSIAREIGDQHTMYQLNESLARTFEGLNDLRRALAHMRECGRLRERLFNYEKQRAIVAMQIRFDMERAEREGEMLRLRAEQLKTEAEGMRITIAEKRKLIEVLEGHLRSLARGKGRDADDAVMRSLLHEIQASLESADATPAEPLLKDGDPQFTRNLLQRCPALTLAEIDVCHLVRRGFSNKEIAATTHTKVRTVETHRRNIRKKLQLDPGNNLATYFSVL